MIANGCVFVIVRGQRQVIDKSSYRVEPEAYDSVQIDEVRREALQPFVSRGGLKMQGALQKSGLNVQGFHALDVGISTGGFTDCLLRAGANFVVGVDVGHGQLASELIKEPRVRLFEGVNARNLSLVPLIESNRGEAFDLVVIDVSFISLTLVLPEVIRYLREEAPVLALVKPQFEVGRQKLGKSGIVKDTRWLTEVEAKIRLSCQETGLRVEDYFASTIKGSDGNQEFFVYARKDS